MDRIKIQVSQSIKTKTEPKFIGKYTGTKRVKYYL